MTISAAEPVPADRWESTVRQARDDGFGYFDWLGCVDDVGRSDTFRVLLMLRDLTRAAAEPRLLSTSVPRTDPRLASVASVFPGAGWHERETAELFGVEFTGGDPRRLLLDPGYAGTPLRKDEVLAARTGVGWPGAKDPGEAEGASPGRRRMVPPGVPDPAVWGDRDPGLPPAGADEVADSAVGGRVRRRSR